MQHRLKISIFFSFFILASMFSCKSKKICAAYNSYFVYDETNIAPFFAPFGSDSLPPEKKANRFNPNGILNQSNKRQDKNLLKYKFEDFKAGEINPLDTNLMMAEDDSMGAIINIKELFPEKINTDQEAYEHYMKKLNADFGKKKSANKGTSDEIQEFDSTAYYNNPPDMLTKEEQKQWKKDKKAYKKRKKAKDKARRKEEALKEEEEGEDEEDFDFDFDE